MRSRYDIVVGILALVLLAAPLAARAQPAGKMYRVGFLGNSTAALEANLVGPFREGLRELGYVEGRIVPSLSQPGGNITGLTSISTEMDGKRLELLREVIPSASYIAVLWNAASPLQVLAEKQVQTAARELRMRILSLGVRTEEEINDAFAAMVKERPDALLVLADRLLLHHRARIMEFAAQQRLPGVHAYRELVNAGGLMSFGPSYADMHRRAAYFVDRILKGTRPADLPVERPATFDLVINLRAAKALGLTIPQAVLLRATEIIHP